MEDLVLDGKIMLESILNKLDEKLWTALFWPMVGTNAEILYTAMWFWGSKNWGYFLTGC